MIIILEGINGVGKSTYARLLHERVGAVPFRAFRPSAGCHFNGSYKIEHELSALNVPFNTYVDDLYVADFLSKIRPAHPIVLDRSIASGIAYGSKPTNAAMLLDLWSRLLGGTPALYVELSAPIDVAISRVVARGDKPQSPAVLKALQSSFSVVYELIHLPRLRVDTTEFSVEAGVERILLAADLRERAP